MSRHEDPPPPPPALAGSRSPPSSQHQSQSERPQSAGNAGDTRHRPAAGDTAPTGTSAGRNRSPPRPADAPPSNIRRKNYAIGTGKQITRSRVSYSCHTCRRRKVKCDKVHPVCSNCTKTGSQCVYDTRSLHHPRHSEENHHLHHHHHHHPHSRSKQHRKDLHRLADVPLAKLLSGQEGSHGPGSLDAQQQQQQQQQGAAGNSEEIAARLDRLTSMVARLSQTQSSQQDRSSDAIAAQGQRANQDLTSLAEPAAASKTNGTGKSSSNGSAVPSRFMSRSSSPKRYSDQSGNEDFPIPAGLETDLVDPVGTLNLGHLSLDECGKSQYVGTTYWAYISDEIHELNKLLREQSRTQDPMDPKLSLADVEEDENASPYRASDTQLFTDPWPSYGEAGGATDFFLKPDSPASSVTTIRPEILDNIPTRRQSNILYKGFMSGVQSGSPVTHPPTVLRKYNAFWEWYEHGAYTGDPFPKPSFIPLLYAIWYGGSVTISLRTIQAEFDVETRSALSGRFHGQVTSWLKRISFPRNASVYGLAAFLLVQTILSKEEEPLTSSLFISLSLRVAQTMGLHRDPAQFGVHPCDAEARRRVWWHIVHMDGVVAMSSGLPPQVSDENYWDVRVPSEVKDTLLGTPEAEQYERLVEQDARNPDRPDDPNVCGNSMVNVHYIAARGKYVMAQAIRKILKIQLGTKPVTRKDMEDLRAILIDLSAKLRALVDRIPIPKPSSLVSNDGQRERTYPNELPFIKPDLPNGGPGCGEHYHTPVLAAFHKWARILLSLFIHKAFCVAYQPFLKNAKSKIWPSARQCALRHCHGYMETFILLATDPDFQPFQWSWPGNHQPMHATMIMLIDLYERPTSPEAPESRAFIDKVFSLSGPDGGVAGGEDGVSMARPLKDGGREAWDMMRRLREKAWQKAGLDPNVLWTEPAHAQAQAGGTTAATTRSGASASASASAPHFRTASQGQHDVTSSPTTVADRYYSMLNEGGYDDDDDDDGHGGGKQYNPGTYQPSPSWAGFKPELSQLWQDFNQQAQQSQAQQPPSMPPSSLSQTNETPPSFFDTITPENLLTTASNNPALPAQFQPRQPSAPDFPPKPSSTNNTTDPMDPGVGDPSPNVNFDWDQWDAVFGEYLPVVDGFMDLDPLPLDS